MRKSQVVAIAIVAVLGLSACTSDTDVAVSASSSPPVVVSSEPTPMAIETPSELPDVSLPADVDPTSDAAIAWEALMSPVGEYAAAAMYQAVIDEFGQVEPYVTIKAAEERHISALIRQLDRYGVEVPENPYIGVVAAPADLTSAAKVWAIGEIDNVAMYDELLASVTDSNLIRVLTNLRRASQDSHLPMFEAAAENGGVLTADQMATMGMH